MSEHMNKLNKFIRGGFFMTHRTYIMSGVGIVSAIAAYLVGDTDVFIMLQSVFALGGIYFLRKSNNQKGESNG